MGNTSSTADPTEDVPGSNDAKYGPVPREEQTFDIEFLEIAPTPMPMYDLTESDRPLLAWLMIAVETNLHSSGSAVRSRRDTENLQRRGP